MYLIISDADNNVTPKVFYDGVDVIRLRVVGEEKGWGKRSDGKGPSEKIHLRRFVGEDPSEKSDREDPTEKAHWRRGLTPEPIMALIPCEMREEKKCFSLFNE